MEEPTVLPEGIMGPAETPRRPDEAPAGPVYHYAPDLLTLAALQVATLGFYSTYWFYAHWRSIKDLNREALSPFWRAIFGGLFSFSLFRRFEARGVRFASVPAFAAVFLLSGYFWLKPPPFSQLGGVLAPLVVMVLAQAEINNFWRVYLPTQFRPAELGAWGWAALILGALSLKATLPHDIEEAKMRYGAWETFTADLLPYSAELPERPVLSEGPAGEIVYTLDYGRCVFTVEQAREKPAAGLPPEELRKVSDAFVNRQPKTRIEAVSAAGDAAFDYDLSVNGRHGYARTLFAGNNFFRLQTSCGFPGSATRRLHDKFAGSFRLKQ